MTVSDALQRSNVVSYAAVLRIPGKSAPHIYEVVVLTKPVAPEFLSPSSSIIYAKKLCENAAI